MKPVSQFTRRQLKGQVELLVMYFPRGQRVAIALRGGKPMTVDKRKIIDFIYKEMLQQLKRRK